MVARSPSRFLSRVKTGRSPTQSFPIYINWNCREEDQPLYKSHPTSELDSKVQRCSCSSTHTIEGAYLHISGFFDPGNYSKAQPERKGVFEGCQDGHGLSSFRPVTVHHVGHSNCGNCAENPVCDSGSRNRHQSRQVLTKATAPEHDTDGPEDEWTNKTPQAILWFEISASPF